MPIEKLPHHLTPKFEYNEIIDGIYIGTNQCCRGHFEEELTAKGITADISLEKERLDAPFGVDFYVWIPVGDHAPPAQDQLDFGVSAIKKLVAMNRKIYVHCEHGHGRAPTLVAAYLISLGKTPQQAEALIKSKRPTIHLEETQRSALRDFYGRMLVPKMNMPKTIFTLFASIIIAQMAGVIGSFFTTSSIQTWYAFLAKPLLSPPSWVFAPAWVTLYTLMGIAAFLVWSSYAKATDGQARKRIKIALCIYLIQLLLNASWSIVFFGLRSPFWAFLVIIILWLLILLTMVKFWKIRTVAGILFVPYILWVTFAAYLNFAIWLLN
ncbi:MAG: tryptophan-rich sensory protein [Candidatus Nealsonbacteria bacterium]|nr:tryptophan-rich sensory protein [Candidatus Nealsonbacteria bacterium]